jgi:hypothetical protein
VDPVRVRPTTRMKMLRNPNKISNVINRKAFFPKAILQKSMFEHFQMIHCWHIYTSDRVSKSSTGQVVYMYCTSYFKAVLLYLNRKVRKFCLSGTGMYPGSGSGLDPVPFEHKMEYKSKNKKSKTNFLGNNSASNFAKGKIL